jgi:hypothetical protein
MRVCEPGSCIALQMDLHPWPCDLVQIQLAEPNLPWYTAVNQARGAHTCRARKISVNHLSNVSKSLLISSLAMKCDRARPTCWKCRRATRACPGYRDKLSLWFQNETQNVIQKWRPAGLDTGDDTGHQAQINGTDVNSTRKASETQKDKKIYQLSPLFTFVNDQIFQATGFFSKAYSWLNLTYLSACHANQN